MPAGHLTMAVHRSQVIFITFNYLSCPYAFHSKYCPLGVVPFVTPNWTKGKQGNAKPEVEIITVIPEKES